MALPSLLSSWYRTLIYGTMEGIRTCMYYTLKTKYCNHFLCTTRRELACTAEFIERYQILRSTNPSLFNQNSNLNTLWHWLIARHLVYGKVWLLSRTVLVGIATQSHCDMLALNKYEQSLQQSTLQVLGLLRMRLMS